MDEEIKLRMAITKKMGVFQQTADFSMIIPGASLAGIGSAVIEDVACRMSRKLQAELNRNDREEVLKVVERYIRYAGSHESTQKIMQDIRQELHMAGPKPAAGERKWSATQGLEELGASFGG